MTTVMLHDGAVAPAALERPQPAVKVVRGGDYGLNRARRLPAWWRACLRWPLCWGWLSVCCTAMPS